MSIHTRIKNRRLKLELSHSDVAARIAAAGGGDIVWQTVQSWEREGAKKAAPKRERMPYVAIALECTEEWLVTGRGNMTTSGEPAPVQVTPEDPPVARMTLQYCTPEENDLLELYRLCYQAGRDEVLWVARTMEKRPLSALAAVDNTKM